MYGTSVEGTLFGLFKNDATVFSKENAIKLVTTDENGEFVFENVPYGDWIVRELETSKEYLLSEVPYLVSIDADGEVEQVDVTNIFVTGTVQLVKVDAKDSNNKLSGAVFELYADTNANQEFDEGIDALLCVIPETEKGIYKITGLRYGNYLVGEKVAPEGYIRDERYFSFNIEEDGEIINVENEEGTGFVNQPVVEVPKMGDETKSMLWLALSGAAIITLVTINLYKKREHEKEQGDMA